MRYGYYRQGYGVRHVFDIIARLFGARIEWGSARLVWITARRAFKFARWDRGAIGFRANLNESRIWAASPSDDLCPVLWTGLLGFLIVMPPVIPLTLSESARLFDDYIAEAGAWSPRLSGDPKPENYGTLDGRRVRVDYEGKRLQSRC